MMMMTNKLTLSVIGITLGSFICCGAALADGRDRVAGSKGAGAEPVDMGYTFGGIDFAKDSTYSYQGIVVALNRDISKDGFLLRAYGSFVNYDYANSDVSGGKTTGDGWQADLMVGYQWNRPYATLSALIGIDYQNQKLTPDDRTAKIRGEEVGFKVAANISSSDDVPYFFDVGGEYSTAFETYWSRARVGAKIMPGRLTIGPEAIAYGGDGYDNQRVGAFVTLNTAISPRLPVEITVSGGHQFVRGDSGSGSSGSVGRGGGEGPYGQVNLGFTF